MNPMNTAPRDGRWITIHRPGGRKIRAAWLVPFWSIFRDPTKPAWISDQFKFADPFGDALGWSP
jgi:hypothetical protein